nr:ABC transporter ATP-binding protein [uncultured Agathobaculum sp.]
MENALEIKGLCKQYEGFALENVSFTLPRGAVMGFIGENGAGKTTTIKSILHLIHRDEGEIRVLGLDNEKNERAVKERIGVVLEDGCFLNTMNARQVDTLMGKAYKSWQSAQFFDFMKRFGIDERKKIKDYSKGMRMKISIAAALSHGAELLIMDEPTSGLDPVVRDEVLDLFYDFMQDESHAILLSSHITSDLDKIADYITFIHQGRIVLSEPRDALLDTYGVLRCTADQLASLDPAAVRAKRVSTFGCEALVRRSGVPQNWPVEPVNIEQIMLFLTRGEEVR